MNQFFKRIVISLAAVFAGVMAFAQVTTSSISGKVSDANGALPGVTILALHEPTGTQYYAITDEKGFYRLNNRWSLQDDCQLPRLHRDDLH